MACKASAAHKCEQISSGWSPLLLAVLALQLSQALSTDIVAVHASGAVAAKHLSRVARRHMSPSPARRSTIMVVEPDGRALLEQEPRSAQPFLPESIDDDDMEEDGEVDTSRINTGKARPPTEAQQSGPPAAIATAERQAAASNLSVILRASDLWERMGSSEATAPPDGLLQPAASPPFEEPAEPAVIKALEGLGASAFSRSPAGDRALDRELRQRLETQDVLAVVILVTGLGMTVLVTCFSVYKGSEDGSPATFYTEPGLLQPRLLCQTCEVQDFLQSFNSQPRSASLRIVGWRREPRGGWHQPLLDWLQWLYTCSGGRNRNPVMFDVVLDLAPFIAGDGTLTPDEESHLERLLMSTNPLQVIVLQKKVDWKLWEDVATNIRQRLRSLGFIGSLEISFDTCEEVLIYRNHPWTNFVRNPVTHALAVLSIVGIFMWKPYVWMRTQHSKVRTHFSINLDPERYWDLLASGLDCQNGFVAH